MGHSDDGSFRLRKWSSLAVAVIAAASLALASCGDDDDGGGGGGSGGDGGGSDKVRVAVTSGETLGDVPGVSAAVENGDAFDITASPDDIKRFDSHATAMQVLLSGGAEVVSGSFVSDLKLIEQGRDLKVFCGVQNATEENFVGTGDTDSIEDLKTGGPTLAIDSPGGAADFFMNFLLYAEDAGFFVKDVENKTILEDGDQRLSAMQNGEADASILAFNEIALLEEQVGADNVNVISVLAEDIGDQSIYIAFAAESKWLDENTDLAARFCATSIDHMNTISADYDAYKALIEKYIEPPPPEKDIRQLWDLNKDFTVWPDTPIIDEEQYQANLDVALASGLLEKEVPYDQAIDRKVMDEAKKLLDEKGS
jgi:NitT/TauT family transport system substrate-binding protein